MRQSSVTPEEWTRHRKLRKKIASAKWYAHKKQREIDEQREHREELERLRQEADRSRYHFVWHDPGRRAEWFAVVACLRWGYPERPSTVEACQWRQWVERIESEIDALEQDLKTAPPRWSQWLQHTWVRKIFRQFAIREIQGQWNTDRPVIPRGCCCTNRLWSTSIWNWLWVMTHLGNAREDFPILWCHLHRRALHMHPAEATEHVDPCTFLLSDPECFRWIDRMADHLEELLQEPANLPDSDRDTSSQEPEEEEEEGYVTQEPTPDWVWALTDSDSESLPSSLDNFVTDTFAITRPSEWLP